MAKTRKRTPSSRSERTKGPAEPETGAKVPEAPAESPDPDRIARRAYELYRERGGADGAALEDWLAAEQELNRSTPEDRDE